MTDTLRTRSCLLLSLLLLVFLVAAACTDDEAVVDYYLDGDSEAEDSSDGDTEADGDLTDGDLTDGDVTDGDATDGDATDGDTSDGDVTDGDLTDGDASDGDAPENFPIPEGWMDQEINWEACDLYEGGGTASQREAECAVVDMPVNWYEPEGQTLQIRLKRLVQTDATRQAWLLHGGPGGPGTTGLAFMADYLYQADSKLDIYLLDHRGTGYSTRMGCPEYEADESEGGFGITETEMPLCADWLENEWDYPIEDFNVTQAAIDVGYLVALSDRNDRDSFVYGVSYGAYWGHRYSQLFPSQVDGIILDSIPPSAPTYLEQYDLYADLNIRKLFAHCAEDDFCRSKLGDDPTARAEEILQSFKDGHCSELTNTYGITLQFLNYTLFTLGRDVYSRILVPALYYRLERCEADDAFAIYMAVSRIVRSEYGFDDRQYGTSLGNHIVLSELLSDEPMTIPELEEAYEDLLVNNYLGLRVMNMLPYWPVYEWDDYVRGWADERAPLLMMNSSFDLQTPIELAISARDTLTGDHQYFFEIPYSNHGVITQSPVKTRGKPDCGAQIMMSYMDDPQVAPDSSCLDNLRPVDFAGDPAYNQYYLGTTDAWENADVSIDCGLPEEFLNQQTPGYLDFLFDGTLADWQPGPGKFHAVAEGVTYDVHSYAVAADRRTTGLGTEVVAMMGYGGLVQYSATEYDLNYAETMISVNALNALKESGEHRIDYTFENKPFFGYLARVSDKTIGLTRYVRLCPKGVLAYENLNPRLWVCHEGNTEFADGEPFEAAGNVPLVSDPERYRQVFGIVGDGDCFCYIANSEAFDCTDWDSLASGKKKELKTWPMPELPSNIRLPDLPRYTPENMPAWRKSSAPVL